MAALSTLGRQSPVLCVARPGVLHLDPTVRTVVRHVAAHAGGNVVYAALEGEGKGAPPHLGHLLDVHERMLLRLQALRGEGKAAPRPATWGRVPWGYRLSADGMSLEPNLAERAVVAVARHMRLRGLKLRQIVDELKKLGVVNRNGRPFGITRVYELLDEGDGSRREALADDAATDGNVPPVSLLRSSIRALTPTRHRGIQRTAR